MAESEEELKSLLMRMKEQSERAGLKRCIKNTQTMASGPITLMATRRGIGGSSDRFPLLGLQNHCGWWLQLWSEKMIVSWQGSYNRPRKCVEKQRHYCADKGPNSQDYCLPIGHIWLWELDHEEGRTPKNWCLQTMVLENTPESPLDSKITPVNLKGNQPWILIGRSDAEAPEFWSSYTNSWLIGKVPDAGKDSRRRGCQRMRWLDAITGAMDMNLGKLGDGQCQGCRACWGSWGCKESAMKELNRHFSKETHEKKLNITHYQRNANQNHNEVPSHAGQNGCYQKVYKQ